MWVLYVAVQGLGKQLSLVSPLGTWDKYLTGILRLVSIKAAAKALAQSPAWLGKTSPDQTQKPDEGRQVLQTLLGPAFALAVLPDLQPVLPGNPSRPQPDVAQSCFSDNDNRRPGEVAASVSSLRLNMFSIVGQLHDISMQFMRNQVNLPLRQSRYTCPARLILLYLGAYMTAGLGLSVHLESIHA